VSRRRRIVLEAVALAGLAAFAVAAAARPSQTRGSGCDRSRPAVAHFAGGVRLHHQPRIRPVACMTLVGRAVESATIGVTRSGGVLFAARDDNTAAPPENTLKGPEFVVRSRNGGASWTALGSGGPTTGGLVPPWMSVDPQTSRIWFLNTLPSLCGARISWSDDDGNRWRTNPKVGCPGQGGEKILEGPPPARGAPPHGYPHVVYYCANGGLDTGPTTLACYRSLDGGRTFAPIRAVPDPPGRAGKCGVNHVARPGIAGPDGNLYMSLDLCGNLGIAISRDEGATWQRRRIARTQVRDVYTTSIASDSAGDIYVAWLAAARGVGTGPNASAPTPARGLPYLVISRDHGRTWSKPMMVASPGVRQAFNIAIAAARRGHVAISYLGAASKAAGASFSGYITESLDVLSRRPVFLSAAVNPPSRPLYPGLHHETFGDRLFFIGDAIGPDGTPWAAFHCVDERMCPGERIGVAARLEVAKR
jgi:BNR/Asp-box repeat